MKKYLFYLGYFSIILFICQSFIAPLLDEPPSNDNCTDVTPTTLTIGTLVSFTGTTVGGTASDDEMNNLGEAVVWEAVTLPECSTLTVDFCGTAAGNMNEIYAIAAKDCSFSDFAYPSEYGDCEDGNRSYTFQYLPAGTYYLPVIANPDYSTLGEYKMNVIAVACPPAPANDNCEDVTPTVLTNGTPITFTGTTEMQTASPAELDAFGTAVVWEAITLTGERNNLKVDFCGTLGSNNPQIYYTTSCPVTTIVNAQQSNNNECGDGKRTGYFNNLPAGTYYLPVNLTPSNNNPTGTYIMNVLSVDAPPAPENDNCEDVTPTVLTNGTAITFTGTTVGATSNPAEVTIIGNRPVVWEAVTLTAECNSLTISYCGTPAETNVGMNNFITPSCNSSTSERIFNQSYDFTSCSDEKLTLYWYNLPAGTYYIPVITDLSSYTPGEYTMNVLSEDCPPVPANDNCDELTPTELISGTPITFTGTTEGATSTPHEMSLFGKPVVWEAVTLTGACNNLTIDFCGTDSEIVNYWSMLKVYLDSCSATTSTTGVANNTSCEGNYNLGTVHFYDLPAGTYYIPIAVNYNKLGEYTMNVISEDCPVIPENDDCEDAIALSCGETYTGSTMGASDSGGNTAKDVFYTYTGNGTEEFVTLSLCGSDYDTFIRVYSDCTLTNEIASNDNFCGTQSQVSFTSNGTSTYVIMVEGAGSIFGNYELKVNCVGTNIPVNDNCEDAIALSCGETETGNTIFATDSGGNSTSDVFYSYTGEGAPELITVSLCGSTYNTFLRVFKDCTLTEEITASSNSLSCNGNQSELSFVSDGTSTYIIMVEGKVYPDTLSKGAYEISLTCGEAPPALTCETTLIPSDNIRDAMTLGHVGSFGTQYAVDIPVGDAGYTIEGFIPTVLSASSYFNFIFFEDNGGLPGAELFTRAGTIEGSENLGTLFSVPVLKYIVKFDPVALEPNKTYWIQIDCNAMGWGYSELEPMRLGYPDAAYNWTDDVWESMESQNQLAFELICSELGVSDLNSFEFSYYPNPVKDVLNISSLRKVESVSVFNLNGQKLINDLKVVNGQINVDSLTPGTYVFRAILEGGQIETFKIIKK